MGYRLHFPSSSSVSHIILPLFKHRAITTFHFPSPVPIKINILHTSNHRFVSSTSHTIRPESMFFRRFIVDKQLSVLSIAQRLILGCINDAEPAPPATLCFAEYDVDFFEGAVSGFGVEEVNDWEDKCIDYGEDNVGFVSDG